jgi:hypothetical protein
MSGAQLAITFGTKYAREPHSTLPNAHPEGYVVVEGASYKEARLMAYELTDGAFAFDYEIGKFITDPKTAGYYPRGEIGRIIDGVYHEAGEL